MHIKNTYRYSSKKYNDSLLNLGIIRIGTLHDFRNTEHKNGISDPTEGIKHVSHHIKHISASSGYELAQNYSHDTSALEAFGAIKINNNSNIANISLRNISMTKTFNEEDCFILCSSIYKSEKTMLLFEGADSCIEICNEKKFYEILTNVLNKFIPIEYIGICNVTYKDRQERWNGSDWGLPPALIKEKNFKEQGERRAIWKPKYNLSIKPLIVCDYNLVSCISCVII